MILADKIMELRKKNGWSQEELADRLNVTRQSVSKWEGAQSVPDLERILQMSRIFGVSTDYLLKDEMEEEEYVKENSQTEGSSLRRVTLQEATEFLEAKRETGVWIAVATVLCILSPITLFLLGALSEQEGGWLSDNMAAGAGMIVLILMVACAVAIFISCRAKTGCFDYLEKEEFETEYGVSGMVRERQRQYQGIYNRSLIVGSCLCILSPIPLFSSIFMAEDTLVNTMGLCGLLIFVAAGVFFFIVSGINWESFQKLQQEGDYTRKAKARRRKNGPIATIYWLVVTALFLGYSLWTENWEYSWIFFVVAGVLFAAVLAVTELIAGRNTD